MTRRRYFGTTRFFNVRTRYEFTSGLDFHFNGDELEGSISSAIDPNRKVSVFATRTEARAFRRLIRKMEREDYRARRMAGEFAIPKPTPKKSEAAPCSMCSGVRGNYDDEGNWLACPRCTG